MAGRVRVALRVTPREVIGSPLVEVNVAQEPGRTGTAPGFRARRGATGSHTPELTHSVGAPYAACRQPMLLSATRGPNSIDRHGHGRVENRARRKLGNRDLITRKTLETPHLTALLAGKGIEILPRG